MPVSGVEVSFFPYLYIEVISCLRMFWAMGMDSTRSVFLGVVFLASTLSASETPFRREMLCLSRR